MITPDYSLLHTVQILSDGADAHEVAQGLNTYTLAIHGLNQSGSDEDRAMLEGVLRRAERELRSFVTQKRMAVFCWSMRAAGNV